MSTCGKIIAVYRAGTNTVNAVFLPGNSGSWYAQQASYDVRIGMVPRGEVGIVVALVGLQLGTISNSLYAVGITMSMATTLVVPPALKLALSRR